MRQKVHTKTEYCVSMPLCPKPLLFHWPNHCILLLSSLLQLSSYTLFLVSPRTFYNLVAIQTPTCSYWISRHEVYAYSSIKAVYLFDPRLNWMTMSLFTRANRLVSEILLKPFKWNSSLFFLAISQISRIHCT